jgi:crotonobetainyl-CoA:carnitine CoA-transferase CaiB-like acyl-CoA transferase
MNKTLDGVRVIELAQYISGPYCGMLLAGLGARVTKIEGPVNGDISRRCGPFPKNIPHTDQSGLFHYLNRNKYGITLDIRNSAGREILLELIKEADVTGLSIPEGGQSGTDRCLHHPIWSDRSL